MGIIYASKEEGEGWTNYVKDRSGLPIGIPLVILKEDASYAEYEELEKIFTAYQNF